MIKKFKDLMTSVDVLNTMYGGISEPYLSLQEEESGRELRVRVPGIAKESLQVEIEDNALSVFYLIPLVSERKLIHMPQVVYNQIVPYFIDVSQITAAFEDDELVVQLPFNKFYNGFNRKIEIGEG
jgi:HSP20 family molecular chaperone IbpA